jgi:N6-adenosine-specific RNA methylase IME4
MTDIEPLRRPLRLRNAVSDVVALRRRLAKAVDEVLAEAERGTVTEQRAKQIKKAAKAIRARDARRNHAARTQRLAAISANSAELPTGRLFPVFYADPAWKFEVYDDVTGGERSPERYYPTTTTDKIAAMRFGQRAATNNAVLFLWATVPMLPQALEVMKAWDFDYKSQFVWVKDQIGTGYWNRNQHELLLIGTRGNFPAPLPERLESSVIKAARREHSRKPDEARDLIKRMYPDLPRIELFARERHEGWNVWGNEVTEDAA